MKLRSVSCFLPLVLAALIGFSVTACDNGSTGSAFVLSNYYSYGNVKITNFAWAGFYFRAGSGYELAISPTVPSSTTAINNEPNILEVQIPLELMGQWINPIDYDDIYSWEPYGLLKVEGTFYQWWSDCDSLSGYNRIRVTKNSANNFTIELTMKLEGEFLQCYYTGDFTEYFNWMIFNW